MKTIKSAVEKFSNSHREVFVRLNCVFPAVPPKFATDKYNDTIYMRVGTSTALEIPFHAYPMP